MGGGEFARITPDLRDPHPQACLLTQERAVLLIWPWNMIPDH